MRLYISDILKNKQRNRSPALWNEVNYYVVGSTVLMNILERHVPKECSQLPLEREVAMEGWWGRKELNFHFISCMDELL